MKRFVFLVFASVFSLGIPATSVAQEDAVRPAKVAQVQSSETVFERRYPAIVRPSLEAVLSFRVSGRVIELPIRASTDVKEGDVIAKLDPRDFERQIAQLQTQKDQSLAQLAALRSGARSEEVSALEAGIDAVDAQ
ncbi:biotin/lipoyl-binding protein, partial [Litoreibacter sp.]|nr:biotin/lipoyl-binding protein [Litoreibacter sp.]